MQKFKGKVVVITGASAGIGRAIAQAFAKEGASLGLIARGVEKLESTLTEVHQLGGTGLICPLDVIDQTKMEEAALAIEKKFGPIDLWINNAMVTLIGEVNQLNSEEIKRVMDVNYLGSVNGIMVASRRFRARNSGHIIQIGSALAYLSIPLQSAYCASKHAIHGFIQSYRIELKAAKSAFKISEVHLPGVNTPQFEWMKNYMPKHPMPVPPIFNPELMAKAVIFIAQRPRNELWVGGSAVKAILGAKMAAGFTEYILAKNGINNQQTNKAPPTKQDNLWKPINRDYGARGIFTEHAKNFSIQLWLDMYRIETAIAAIVILFVGLLKF